MAERRSIPARAGEPAPSLRGSPSATVYPRTGGGTKSPIESRPWALGLSPHGRGNHADPPSADRVRRSIPARAGEPESESRPRCSRRVYPCTGGGTPLDRACGLVDGGSIPARAGEPAASSRTPFQRRVYPRTGGGTARECGRGVVPRGLSPHGRGNQRRVLGVVPRLGSIPARAGEPQATPILDAMLKAEVYPRTGGGTSAIASSRDLSAGLSPHGRGNLEDLPDPHPPPGSIPARAGEPSDPRPTNGTMAVYPRTGGGTCQLACETLRPEGLSPHGRGNRMAGSPAVASRGSIPARAGEPRVPGTLPHPPRVGSIPARAGEPLPSNRLIILNC